MTRGRIDATPAAVAAWVKRFAGHEIHVALEACTGWLFVAHALSAMGAVAHLAEPVVFEVCLRRVVRRMLAPTC